MGSPFARGFRFAFGVTLEVAVFAGCSEVGLFPPGSSVCDGVDVVDFGCVHGAFGAGDLAAVLVAR